MNPGVKFLFGRVLPWPLVLAGAAVLFLGMRDFNRGRESVTWPAVEGHVVGSWMAEVRHKSYLTGVLYDYRLSGVTYSSDRILFEDYGLGDSGFSHAQDTMNRYPRETSVQVHYNPRSPELSVLETGVHGQIHEVLIMGLLLFGFGCSLLWRRPKRCRRIPAQTSDNDGSS